MQGATRPEVQPAPGVRDHALRSESADGAMRCICTVVQIPHRLSVPLDRCAGQDTAEVARRDAGGLVQWAVLCGHGRSSEQMHYGTPLRQGR